jgi:hypothetical protein
MAKKPKKPEDRLKLDMTFEEATKRLVAMKKPAGGWPKPPAMPQRARKNKGNK